MPHKPAVFSQHVQQSDDLRQRFADLVDGGCLGFGGTSGIDPLADERELRVANVRYALGADLITLGRAIDLFLAEVIGARVKGQDG